MSSQAHAVIVALTAAFTAAGSLAGVKVVDGPQVTSDPSDGWLFVGFDGAEPTEHNEGALIEQDLMTFARGKKETGEIRCAAVVVSGDPTAIVATRQRALAIVSAAEDVVRADMTIGSLVMHAFVAAVNYIPSQTDKGAKVRVVFTVKYQAQF